MSDGAIEALLIEDNEADVETVRRLLAKSGDAFRLQSADRLETGLELLDEGAVSVILLDLWLPDGDGLEVITQVRKRASKVPIIILTGRQDEDLAIQAARRGAQDYLVKGKFDADGLSRTIRYSVERKKAEGMLVLLATAVEHAGEGILITDAAGHIQYTNPAFERITGYTRDEIVGQTPHVLQSGEHDAAFYRQMWARLGRGEVWSGRLINKKKDEKLFEAEETISPVLDGSGRPDSYVAIMRDVTEIVALEVQLRQAQKLEAIGQLAAGIAHEINTPIQFVGDNTHFLSGAFQQLRTLIEAYSSVRRALEEGILPRDRLDALASAEAEAELEQLTEEIPQAIDQMLEGVERVARIVRAMKDFSHPGPTDAQKRPTDINRALESTLTVAHNELKYVADVVTSFDPDLPPVPCHLGDMNQVFLNLLVNAAHAIGEVIAKGSRDKGTITVSTRMDGDDALISVADTGCGIPDHARDRIFEPFFTTKEVGKGTGQGLAIAHSVVVDKHGGSLTFETEVGEGTTFTVRLPTGTIKPNTTAKHHLAPKGCVHESP